MVKTYLRVLAVSAVGLLLGSAARADILGSIWENDVGGASDATPANVPVTTPNVTFDLPGSSIDFSSGGLYTIGEFLSSNGSGTTVLTGASQLGNTLDNTIFNFTGTVTVTNGQSFQAGHDDGLTLIIGSDTVINAPGGTSFVLTPGTYTGPSGTFAFQLVYGECCGAPADLEITGFNLVSSPEPGSVILTLTLLSAVVFTFRKRLVPSL